MNITRQIFLALTAAFFMTSCGTDAPVNTDKENPSDVFTQIYTTDNLNTQSFTIDNNIDNIVKGINGTIVRIYKNTFVDQDGKPTSGIIEIKFIEALTPIDRVLGNLTTTFENKPLETGGMIFLDAISGSKQLSIAADKSILIKMPTDSVLTNMSVFVGQKDTTGIKWKDPIAIQPGKADSVAFDKSVFEKTTNVKYNVDGFDTGNEPDKVSSEVGRICWEGDGLKIAKDSVLKIEGHTVRFYKQKKLLTYEESFTNEKGVNSHAQDRNTSYIFTIKKLGWANIDRLLEDPRTTEVDFLTIVENKTEFKFIYVTLITQQMYIPGYQKKDETFCFSHGDEEKQKLPVGETAIILATAYKNDKPYFAFKKIKIEQKQTVSFKLIETTKDKLKADLQMQMQI
jgi:hypothetical protein